ncbi:hypothetical protein MKZ38_000649 [Zalerion maritima]|uniref:Uncharacterized protein n=1 Tax=Zalerion maritima TaxID=339359 RepID=A0AAD5WRY5_9PEZI|nr:hypothetical protein MKZ38_000649 [Zalerion maritima]
MAVNKSPELATQSARLPAGSVTLMVLPSSAGANDHPKIPEDRGVETRHSETKRNDPDPRLAMSSPDPRISEEKTPPQPYHWTLLWREPAPDIHRPKFDPTLIKATANQLWSTYQRRRPSPPQSPERALQGSRSLNG